MKKYLTQLIIFSLTFCFASARELEAQAPVNYFEQFGPAIVFYERPDVLFFTGSILAGDYFEIRRALRDWDIRYIALSSPGGSVWEALKIADAINDLNIPVVIPSNGLCASACSFLFFAGRPRLIVGQLGVHQFSTLERTLNEETVQYTASEIIDVLNRYNTPAFVYPRMFRSEELHIFDEADASLISSTTSLFNFPNLQEADQLLIEAQRITQLHHRENAATVPIPVPSITLNEDLTLLSVSDNAALIILASGRYVRVAVGNRFDGGIVTSISQDSLTYSVNGRLIQIRNSVQGQLEQLLMLTNQGVVPAADELGYRYLNGIGTEIDYIAANVVFESQWRRGFYQWSTAQFIFSLDTGRGVQKNPNRAAEIALEYSIFGDEEMSAYIFRSLSRDSIVRVQSILHDLGYYNGQADGILGPMTLDAISRYKAQ